MHHSKESYKHLFAKNMLAEWLMTNYLRVETEVKFCDQGEIFFIADIACYTEDGLTDIFEVVHKNGLDYRKLNIIQYYQYINRHYFNVWEVQAETILVQIQRPSYIKKINFTTQVPNEPF